VTKPTGADGNSAASASSFSYMRTACASPRRRVRGHPVTRKVPERIADSEMNRRANRCHGAERRVVAIVRAEISRDDRRAHVDIGAAFRRTLVPVPAH